jgi:glycosyltransferase involved in cell wall biosynthesis
MRHATLVRNDAGQRVTPTMPVCRIAVVSPFIDKRHGTERRVAEWVSRLGSEYEVHIYSQRVEDIDLSGMRWHRIPKLPGPHLFNFLWWFAANHTWRLWDRRVRGIHHDLVFTAGTNCLDADVISVHIVFAEFTRQIRSELLLQRSPVWFWPRLIHRRLYYRLIMFLERKMYTNTDTSLILIARKTADDLKRFYGRNGSLPIVYIGLDQQIFNAELRKQRRTEARLRLDLDPADFVLLLVGNDWRKKGLFTLLDVMEKFKETPMLLLVAGQDDPYPYQNRLKERGLKGKVRFLPSRPDVEWYYAAADVYVGPSLEDTFAQPPAEAMACGLPVITTITNGTAEIITDGVDGLIVQDPNDAEELAQKIRLVFDDADLRSRLGENAARTTQQYTWDRNGEQIRSIFAETLRRKT